MQLRIYCIRSDDRRIMKRIKDIKLSIGLIVYACIILSSYLIKHLSSDSFIITRLGYKGYAINYSFLDGRIIMGCISLIADLFNVPIIMYNRILLFLAIIISVIAIIKLKNTVEKYRENSTKTSKIALIIACFFTIFNFFYIDNLYYAEGIVMALSIFFYIVAADKVIDGRKFRATMLLLLGIVSYQATISIFFVCVVLFSMLKHNRDNFEYKGSFKKLSVSVILVLIVIALDFVFILIIQNTYGIVQTRVTGTILKNLLVCVKNVSIIVAYTLFYFPSHWFILFIFSTQVLLYIKILKYNKNKKGEVFLIQQLMLIVSCIGFSFIPSVLSTTAFYAARLRFSMGATVGILFIHLIANEQLLDCKKVVNKLLIVVLILFGIANSTSYIKITNINKNVNDLDEKYAHEIASYISEYEKNNSIEVTKVVIVPRDDIMKKYYEENGGNYMSIAIAGMKTEWAVDGMINYYTGRHLERTKVSKEDAAQYNQIIGEENEYVCVEDTLYIVIYHE